MNKLILHIVISLLALIVLANKVSSEPYTPIVIWHGMGDSCCNPFSLGSFKRRLQKALPGVYVTSLKIGKTVIDDMLNGFLLHPDEQIEMACNKIKSDPQLVNGYNSIGFSQGGQFLRALVQRCPEPRMKNLVSLGGQHQGVYGVPQCDAVNSTFCDLIRPFVSNVAYLGKVQQHLVQATYWHDPIDVKAYVEGSTFLADINNEKFVNQTYIDNLQKLENMILIQFEDDEMVQPRESQWFGFYKPGQAKETQSLEESEIYDRLGLDQMNNDKKLHFMSTPGYHLQFEWSWFLENVVEKFFK